MSEVLYDVIVLGAGPAGLAAAAAAREKGASVLVIEREQKAGGILKQCIHDGFGLLHFGERLTGPEYALKCLEQAQNAGAEFLFSAFVCSTKKEDNSFSLELQTEGGMRQESCKALVLACGCRERTARQVFIHGDRPAGVMTAGTAQYFVNVMGCLPTKSCVILGSGDIGLIMARRLTLEGAKVLGVYEAKSEPSGLARNIAQCLNDFSIPLHLSSTVTRVFGSERVEGVEVCRVDENMRPIQGSEQRIDCDALILSVGLIPENEIAESLGVEIDPATKGPFVDQSFMTSVPGVFCCGNALAVHDLVDYVSEGAAKAGAAAALYDASRERVLTPLAYQKEDFFCVVPQYTDETAPGDAMLALRSRRDVKNASIALMFQGGATKTYRFQRLSPAEMAVIHMDAKENGVVQSVHLEVRT